MMPHRQEVLAGIVTDWQKLGDFVTEMPLLRFIAALLDRFTEQSIPAYTGPSGTIEEAAPPVKELETVLDRYINNIRQVEAVGKQFGIQSYFIWQPIPTYAYDPKYHMFYPNQLGCHTGSKYGYPLMKERADEGISVENFLWLANLQQNRRENLYIDAFHYTAPFRARSLSI